MFAARANQENLTYEHQTAGAAKALNNGGNGLAPKTPANKVSKTPFKGQLNNENAALGGVKTGGKGKAATSFAPSKVEATAFVTPAGPRNRAPLGNKTTNAKATAFQTPGALTEEKSLTKPTSPRLRRAKIKVHQADAELPDAPHEREIEYMPPREVPLPDHPDDWPLDRDYPQFEGTNLTNGWWSAYAPQKDDTDDDEFSDFEKKLKSVKKPSTTKISVEGTRKKPSVNSSGLQQADKDPLSAMAPGTMTSKDAAMALSTLSQPDRQPSFAAPTVSAKARLPSKPVSKKGPTPTATAHGNSRHTAARAASNSTLGYSRGRIVSNVRNPSMHKHDKHFPGSSADTASSRTPVKCGGTALDDLFKLGDMYIGDHEAEIQPCTTSSTETIVPDSEALEDFQLEL